MNTVYLVVEYDYEGASVLGVFTDESLADAYAKEYGGAEVESWDLNPSIEALREERSQPKESGRTFWAPPGFKESALRLLEGNLKAASKVTKP